MISIDIIVEEKSSPNDLEHLSSAGGAVTLEHPVYRRESVRFVNNAGTSVYRDRNSSRKKV